MQLPVANLSQNHLYLASVDNGNDAPILHNLNLTNFFLVAFNLKLSKHFFIFLMCPRKLDKLNGTGEQLKTRNICEDRSRSLREPLKIK